jgi:hypothetical protein
MQISILSRGRLVPVEGASARHVGANAWQVTVPRCRAVERAVRRWELDAFDDAVFLLGDDESIQVVGSADQGDQMVLTVLLD